MPEQEVLTEDMTAFLNKLQDSGIINMYGALPYLETNFSLSKEDAVTAFTEWMHSF
jgi:hypothetical protein